MLQAFKDYLQSYRESIPIVNRLHCVIYEDEIVGKKSRPYCAQQTSEWVKGMSST